MKKIFLTTLLAASNFLIPQTASALTLNELKEKCRQTDAVMSDKPTTTEQKMAVANCFGFFEGMASAQKAQALLDERGVNVSVAACFPEKVTLMQLVEIAMKDIKANPEQGHIDSALMAGVLSRAFPCKGDK